MIKLFAFDVLLNVKGEADAILYILLLFNVYGIFSSATSFFYIFIFCTNSPVTFSEFGR